jgi:hypothetical protein
MLLADLLGLATPLPSLFTSHLMHTTQSCPLLISCFNLPTSEHNNRINAAQDREEKKQIMYQKPTCCYGREIIWHPCFAAEFIGSISEIPLYDIGVTLRNAHLDWNDKVAFDLLDYCYLADVLREGLANNPTPLAALRLTRALTWVEQAGAALLPTAQPARSLATTEKLEGMMEVAM